MEPTDILKIGDIIRKIRKKRGLRLEDLADENISPATVSNIERGITHVSPQKVEYLLEKLGITADQLPELYITNQKELANLKFQLQTAEILVRLGEYDRALTKLDLIDLSDQHTYSATYHFIRGSCHLFKKNWRRAEKHLTDAIRLSHQSPQAVKNNIESYSFNSLSLLHYFQNDLEKALEFAESGLDAFNPNGERTLIKYVLLRNKCIYLERLERVVEALKIIQETWDELSNIQQMETVLGFYWLRAELLRRSDVFDEAMYYAQQGIQIASLNHQYYSLFDLFTVLGSIYMSKKEWDKAEDCFNVCLLIPKDQIPHNRYASTYIQLGKLYVEQKRWKEAKELLESAIDKAEESDDAPYLTTSLLEMGNYYRKRRMTEEAIPYYQKSVEIAQKYKYKKKAYKAWFHLAQCWNGINEEEFQRCTVNMFKVEEDIHHCREAKDVYETI